MRSVLLTLVGVLALSAVDADANVPPPPSRCPAPFHAPTMASIEIADHAPAPAVQTVTVAISVRSNVERADVDALRRTIQQIVVDDLMRSGRVNVASAPAEAMSGSAPDYGILSGIGADYALDIDISAGASQTWITIAQFDVVNRRAFLSYRTPLRADPALGLGHDQDVRQIAHGTTTLFANYPRVVVARAASGLVSMDIDGANAAPFPNGAAYSSPVGATGGSVFVFNDQSGGGVLSLVSTFSGRAETFAEFGPLENAGVSRTRYDLIAFGRVSGETGVDIRLGNTQTRSLVGHLPLEGWQGEPSFSPDGCRLAFLSEQAGTRRVLIWNLVASTVAPTGPPGDYKYLVWSPFGEELAFVRRTAAGEELGVMSSAGQVRVLAAEASFDRPSWGNAAMLLFGGTVAEGFETLDIGTLHRVRTSSQVGPLAAPTW